MYPGNAHYPSTTSLDYLAGGMSHEEILHDFPYLTEEDISAPASPSPPTVNASWVSLVATK